MLSVRGLEKKFNACYALKNLSFDLKPGRVLGLIGPNGAGKTTTMRLLLGLLRPTRGEIFVDGYNMLDEKQLGIARQRIGFLPETPALYENLSAYKNLYYFAQLYGVEKEKIDKRICEILSRLGIEGRMEERVRGYSKGMKQKIAIARALLHEPKYLLLDEPTASLDPLSAKIVRDYIKELKDGKRAILIATHNLHEAQELCDEILLLNTQPLLMAKASELQKMMGIRTEVEVESISKEVEERLRQCFGNKYLGRRGNRLIFSTQKAEAENPEIVAFLVFQNVKIRFVEKEKFSLEELYVKLVSGNEKVCGNTAQGFR